jgi:TRAP-type mannitol/chloroaromatic compound transport system permease small subunit
MLLAWMTWPFFVDSFVRNEGSPNAGGLLRWPVKLLLPVGFALMALQGLSEVIKRVAVLTRHEHLVYRYEKPVQ